MIFFKQTWADAFQGQPDLKEVCKVYQELKNKGIEFPMTDLDSMAPIHTPAGVSLKHVQFMHFMNWAIKVRHKTHFAFIFLLAVF